MSREVKAMKDSRDKQKRGMYLILAYMALHKRSLDVNAIDNNLFGELRKKCEPDLSWVIHVQACCAFTHIVINVNLIKYADHLH